MNMEPKTKSSILSIVLISLLSLIIVVFALSLVYRFIIGSPVDPTLDKGIKKLSAEEVIQVNILNACNVKGLAARTRDYLRARGFDVVNIGNYDKQLDTSLVIDRIGDISSARKVAYALGIPDSLIRSDVDSNLFLRSSVILGSDYKNLRPFK